MGYCKFGKKDIRTLITTALLVVLPYNVLAYSPQQPDAGKTLEGLKRPDVALPQQQETKVDIEQENKPPLEPTTGEKFLVKDFRITGQDMIPESELEALLAGSRGKELNLGELHEVARRVTDYFHTKGYILAKAYIPAQDIQNGQVEIAILPGRYGQIIFHKQTAIADSILKMELGQVKSGAYIEKRSLERAIWMINDLSGVEAKASLAPGQKLGTADLIITIQPKDEKNSGSITIDNYGNRFTGRDEVIVTDNINNLSQRGDRLEFGVTTTGSGLKSGNVTYQMPALAAGGKLQFDISRMQYQLGDTYASLDANGTALTGTLSYIQTVKRSQNANLYAQVGFGDKKLRDKIGATVTSDKKVHVATLSLSGDSLDTWGGGGANIYSFGYTAGRLVGSSQGAYSKLNVNLLRQQYVNDRLSMMISMTGQVADKSLDSSEQISLGGAYGVRAYPKGEASGDNGYIATGELRWLLPLADPKAGTLQLTGFVDYGSEYTKANPLRRSLCGGGVGCIWNKPGDCMLRLSYAWKIGSEEAQSDTDRHGRLWLLGTKYF